MVTACLIVYYVFGAYVRYCCTLAGFGLSDLDSPFIWYFVLNHAHRVSIAQNTPQNALRHNLKLSFVNTHPAADPELHAIASSKMVHGPCGGLNSRSACMRDGACTKGFPRRFQLETAVPARGYPLYRRRAPEDGGFTTEPRGRRDADRHRLDNRWVVPFNPFLLRAIKAHVNVEVISHSTACVKYVVKYVNKGSDQTTYTVVTVNGVPDEVTTYQHSRYLSSMEAAWRLLDLPIHGHHPTVEALALHLSEDDRRVQFRNDTNLEAVLQNQRLSKLTAFFQLCAEDAFARGLLYMQIPKYYTWDTRASRW